jgi:hypothetical protein
VSAQATATTVEPGQTAQYTMNVEPTGGVADDVTVQISVTPSGFPAPAFSVCGSGDGSSTCQLGKLQADHPTELAAQVSVPKTATSGETVTLTATATGAAPGASSAGSVSGIAGVRVVAPPPPTTPSPKPTHHSSGHGHHHGHSSSGHSGGGSGSGGGVGTNEQPSGSELGTGLGGSSPLSGLPPLTGVDNSGSSGNPGNRFPTISPSTSPSGPAGSPTATAHARYHPTTVADILPLNTRQVGSQLAGLIVLAIGIAIAVVRVSLRKPRAQGKP